MTTIPPPDDAAYQDNVLMAAIAHVNNQLGRYVLRFLDADAGRAEPLSSSNERALADSVAAIAEGLRARADRRDQHGEAPCLVGPAPREANDV